jgi:hypothetical protein
MFGDACRRGLRVCALLLGDNTGIVASPTAFHPIVSLSLCGVTPKKAVLADTGV